MTNPKVKDILPDKDSPGRFDKLSCNLESLPMLKELDPTEVVLVSKAFSLTVEMELDNTQVYPKGCATEAVSIASIRRLEKDRLKSDAINCIFAKFKLLDWQKFKCKYSNIKQAPPHQLSWSFGTYFIGKLMEIQNDQTVEEGVYKYSGVRRWTKKVPTGNIFLLDKLCIPVNIGNSHWVLCSVFFKAKEIRIYDSLLKCSFNTAIIRSNVFRYILDEYKTMYGHSMTGEQEAEWKFTDKVNCAPQQRNKIDCGIFTIIFGQHLFTGFPPLDVLTEEIKDDRKYAAFMYRYRLRLAATFLKDATKNCPII